MDTVFRRRLFSDPALALLARALKDPVRALGALGFVWSGTQERGLVVATEDDLLACFPLGYRGAKTVIAALVKTGWLVDISEISCRYPVDNPEVTGRYPEAPVRGNSTIPKRYEVRGNLEHVLRKGDLSERNRHAANARWKQQEDARRMRDASAVHARASENDAEKCLPVPVPVPVPDLNTEEGDPAPAREEQVSYQKEDPKPIETMLDAKSSTVSATEAQALYSHWQHERQRLRGYAVEIETNTPPTQRDACRRLIALCGGLAQAKRAVTNYVSDAREHYRRRHWALRWLEQDIDEHLSAPSLPASTPAQQKPFAEQMRDYEAQVKREQAALDARDTAARGTL